MELCVSIEPIDGSAGAWRAGENAHSRGILLSDWWVPGWWFELVDVCRCIRLVDLADMGLDE